MARIVAILVTSIERRIAKLATYYSIVFGIVGLVIGSFLNVVIYRLPRGESIVKPGSHCPSCGHELRAWELIPVFSFLGQRGRCRQCKSKISWRYPAVELLTGVLFFYAVWQQNGVLDARLILNLVFLATLVALAFIDYDTMRLPDVLTLPLLGIGLAGAFLLPGQPSGWVGLASAAGAAALFWLIATFYPRGMGLGDVKLVAALGAFLGFPGIFLAIFLASLLGSLVGIGLLISHKNKLKQHIPFGPFLAAGAIAALFWGQQIYTSYLSYLAS